MALTKPNDLIINKNVLKLINSLTALSASPEVTGDELAVYDASNTDGRKITITELFEAINKLTDLGAVPATADFIPIYDASGSVVRKVSVNNLINTVGSLAAETSLDNSADSIIVYDNSATGAKRIVVDNLVQFTKEFVSSPQSIVNAGTTGNIAHSLGAMPKLVQARMVCQVTEGNYSVNDEVIVNPMWDYTNNYGTAITVDAININVRYGSTGQLLMNKTTGAAFTATNSSWRYVFRAYA